MSAIERAAAQLAAFTGASPDRIWDLRLDTHWRGIVCRVATVPVGDSQLEWDQLAADHRLKLTRAMIDAHRLGRSISGRGIP